MYTYTHSKIQEYKKSSGASLGIGVEATEAELVRILSELQLRIAIPKGVLGLGTYVVERGYL